MKNKSLLYAGLVIVGIFLVLGYIQKKAAKKAAEKVAE
jgi:regulatory protein YycI of two-component signal transduction system YycFG